MKPPIDAAYAPVHAELEDIFRGMARPTTVAPQTRPSVARPRRRPVVWAGCAVATLLLPIGGYLLHSRAGQPAGTISTAPARQPAAPRSGGASPQPRLPMPTSKGPVRPEPRAEPVRTSRSEKSGTDDHPVASHASIQAASPARQADARRKADRSSTIPTSREAKAGCAPAFEAWCLRDVTSAADRRLREDYGHAIEAGVDRATLKRIKRQWVRYRRQANKNPRELLAGFASLSLDLRRITADVESGKARSQR